MHARDVLDLAAIEDEPQERSPGAAHGSPLCEENAVLGMFEEQLVCTECMQWR